MLILIYLLIIVGVILMVSNIARYSVFVRNSMDVLIRKNMSTQFWVRLAFALLVFFLLGYIGIGIFSVPDILVASILCGGSIFVAIVITLIDRLVTTAKERSIDVAEVLIDGIEARDPNLNGHSRYVQNLVMCMWKYIPQDRKEKIHQVSLEYAALLHDVGKLGVPESVLNKPGKLDEEEWKMMKQHPALGPRILRSLHSFDEIMPWIEYHHERIDGKGYYGLKDEEIPYAAKIIAVADTYSAITMKRSYKDARSYEEAIDILKEVRGTQLDAGLVDIFCKIPKEEIEACVPSNVDVLYRGEAEKCVSKNF